MAVIVEGGFPELPGTEKQPPQNRFDCCGFPHFKARDSHKQPKNQGDLMIDTTASKTFITIPELAAEWRVSEGHVYRLVKCAQLPAFKVGERIIVRRDDAKNFLERGATVSAAA